MSAPPIPGWFWPAVIGSGALTGTVAAVAVGELRGAGFAGATVGGATIAAVLLVVCGGWHLRPGGQASNLR